MLLNLNKFVLCYVTLCSSKTTQTRDMFYFPNAGNSVTLEGATDVMVNAGTCTQVQYACVSLAEGSGASYRDADSSDASNVACALVTDILTCFPGLLKHLDTNLHFMLLKSRLSGVKLGSAKRRAKTCLFIHL